MNSSQIDLTLPQHTVILGRTSRARLKKLLTRTTIPVMQFYATASDDNDLRAYFRHQNQPALLMINDRNLTWNDPTLVDAIVRWFELGLLQGTRVLLLANDLKGFAVAPLSYRILQNATSYVARQVYDSEEAEVITELATQCGISKFPELQI